MKALLCAYIFTFFCAIHYSLAQQGTSQLKTNMIKSDIDLSLHALQINEIREADKYLSSAIERVLNDDNKLEYLRFYINYNAEWIHKNPSAFYKLLTIYKNTSSEFSPQNASKLYALYLSYHNWFIYYNIDNFKTGLNIDIYNKINGLWSDIFINISKSEICKNIVFKNEDLIINDGLLAPLAMDRFWCRYFESGVMKIEPVLSDLIRALKQYKCEDVCAYLIQIADRMSLLDNSSMNYARSIYASVAGKSPKWYEYAVSQVCSISCKFGDIEAVMPLYISRLFSDYQYECMDNYYTDICAISPYLEPALVIETVNKAYEIIYNSDIKDKNWKCCTLLTIIGSTYYDLQKYSEAEAYLIRALKLINPHSKIAPIHTLKILSLIYVRQGDTDFAGQLLELVLEEQHHSDPHNIDKTLYELYCLYRMKGDVTLANSYLSSTIETIKKELHNTLLYLPSQERLLYWNLLKNWELFSALHETSPLLEYNIQLLKKGITLQTDINIADIVHQSNDARLVESYKELLLIKRTNEPQLHKLERDFLHLLNTKGNHLLSFIDIGSNDVQAGLGQSDIAIEFADGYKSDSIQYYAALILRKDWDAPKMIQLCRKSDLEPLIKRLQDIYNSKSHRDSAESYIYKRLYAFIWSKLEPYINEGDNVYFSPSGLLHQLNIEVLEDAAGRQANAKWNLHRVSSTRELCMDRPAIKWETAALYGGLVYDMDSTAMLAQSRAYRSASDYRASRGFVADSTERGSWAQLPNTVREINAIDGLLCKKRIKSAKYMQYVGTEESFKALSGKGTSIIHLATHGFFYKDEEAKFKPFFELHNIDQLKYRPDNSLKRSGLILAGAQLAWDGQPIPDRVEDGILLAEEIAAMDLSGTDLVVLSACETGLGEITSEGVFGLQRAFKKAGVRTLIMSLWRVDDAATSLMMRTFYEHLLAGKSKREAFAIAQLAVKSEYKDPYYWASFIMLD